MIWNVTFHMRELLKWSMAINRWFESNPLNYFMNEKDWTRYQVSTKDGIKLVSELKPKEAKN